MVVEVPSLRDAYRLASELRRVGPDVIVEMRVEPVAGDGARLVLPSRLAGEGLLREVVSRYGGRIVQ